MAHANYPVSLAGAGHETLMWAFEHEIESQAVQQIRRVADLPWVYGLRIMPDVHLGVGATIGTVIASESAIVPAAVGVDIGCGVNAVKTSLTLGDVHDDLACIRSEIERTVPVGSNAHASSSVYLKRLGIRGDDKFWSGFKDLHKGVQNEESKALVQLGTLGGGNHFIELCTDSNLAIWITLHSGSRRIGKELAERHIDIAKKMPQNADLPDKNLAVLLLGSPEAEAYSRDLTWAQGYAMRSRTIMMGLVKKVLTEQYPGRVRFEDEINCHHNYVAHEIVDGRKMVVTRKGAISAHAGQLALIPGSMATGSYIVEGLGNPASFESASHGAGRKMSRGEAKRTFTVEDVERTMVGIEARKDAGVIDEISLAYKDLDVVVAAQSDLVRTVAKLDTILCVKG